MSILHPNVRCDWSWLFSFSFSTACCHSPGLPFPIAAYCTGHSFFNHLISQATNQVCPQILDFLRLHHKWRAHLYSRKVTSRRCYMSSGGTHLISFTGWGHCWAVGRGKIHSKVFFKRSENGYQKPKDTVWGNITRLEDGYAMRMDACYVNNHNLLNKRINVSGMYVEHLKPWNLKCLFNLSSPLSAINISFQP